MHNVITGNFLRRSKYSHVENDFFETVSGLLVGSNKIASWVQTTVRSLALMRNKHESTVGVKISADAFSIKSAMMRRLHSWIHFCYLLYAQHCACIHLCIVSIFGRKVGRSRNPVLFLQVLEWGEALSLLLKCRHCVFTLSKYIRTMVLQCFRWMRVIHSKWWMSAKSLKDAWSTVWLWHKYLDKFLKQTNKWACLFKLKPKALHCFWATIAHVLTSGMSAFLTLNPSKPEKGHIQYSFCWFLFCFFWNKKLLAYLKIKQVL